MTSDREGHPRDWPALVERARGGEMTAFDLLVARFQAMAVGYAYSVLGDFHLAEDAAQEAFIQAYFDLPTLEEPLAFPSWLRRIVYKHCDRLTRRKRLPTTVLELGAETASQGPGSNPAEDAERNETHDAVLAAIGGLPDGERAATTLFYIDGYSHAEVGEFLDLPIGTVKSRLHSARGKLRERMVGMVEETLKRHQPGDELGKRVQKVLEGIERIHWVTTSALCFVGSVVAAMHYLGEKVENDYVMGISGGAFKAYWIPPWSPANCDLLDIGEEPIRRTFEALGYEYTCLQDYDRKDPVHTKEFFKSRIVESIDKGRPVLALGVVGPPECCVVSGYDKGGDVLYGRSYFQTESDKYFSVDDWYDKCHGLILIGEKKARAAGGGAEAAGAIGPALGAARKVLRDTLEWAVKLARTPEFDAVLAAESGSAKRLYSGLAAYDAMAEALLRDEDFPAGEVEPLLLKIYALGNDGLWLMTEARRVAALFLEGIVGEAGGPGAAGAAATAATSSEAPLPLAWGVPGLREAAAPVAGELLAAAEAYKEEVGVLGEATKLVPHSERPKEEFLAIADPSRRREAAWLVRKARAVEERAVEGLEAALGKLPD